MWVIRKDGKAENLYATLEVQEQLANGELKLPTAGQLKKLPSRLSEKYRDVVDLNPPDRDPVMEVVFDKSPLDNGRTDKEIFEFSFRRAVRIWVDVWSQRTEEARKKRNRDLSAMALQHGGWNYYLTAQGCAELPKLAELVAVWAFDPDGALMFGMEFKATPREKRDD